MESSEKTEEETVANKIAGTVNWGTATVIGVFAGMFYGGSKEAAASVSKDAEVMLKLGSIPDKREQYRLMRDASTPDKREQYRLMRDAMEKRFIRVTRGSIVGRVRLGMFTAAFYGLQNLLAEKRGVHDVYNAVGAGSATAGTFGLISKCARITPMACEKCNVGFCFGCCSLLPSWVASFEACRESQ